MLAANESKTTRERLTLIRLFEELRGLGYAGGYDAVRRYARRWSRERGASTASAYVPLSFAPGEAYQFDWSHEVVLLSGTTVMVKAAQVRLCHSRMLFVRAYPRETQEMVFDAQDRAFALFKGTCSRGIYDNMKTAVETIFVGRDKAHRHAELADQTIWDVFEADRPKLVHYAGRFDGFILLSLSCRVVLGNDPTRWIGGMGYMMTSRTRYRITAETRNGHGQSAATTART